MTRVLCIFKGCIYNRDNECIKDKILLDENVSDIYIGCPDAVWEESEVKPVKHGEWKCMADCGVTECDQCGWSIEEYVGDYNFCPNCGAKMDGGDDE